MSRYKKPISKSDLKALLRWAISRHKENAEGWRGNDDPQVIELYVRALAKVDAFEAVLFAIDRNELYLLKVEAAGHIQVNA